MSRIMRTILIKQAHLTGFARPDLFHMLRTVEHSDAMLTTSRVSSSVYLSGNRR
jgi:hypothetical protein